MKSVPLKSQGSKTAKATNLDVRRGTFLLLVTTEESGKNRRRFDMAATRHK